MAWQMTEDEKLCRQALMAWKMIEDETFCDRALMAWKLIGDEKPTHVRRLSRPLS
jgi:hypothetical protein